MSAMPSTMTSSSSNNDNNDNNDNPRSPTLTKTSPPPPLTRSSYSSTASRSSSSTSNRFDEVDHHHPSLSSSSSSSLEVVLFVPNVLGYLRIGLALASLWTLASTQQQQQQQQRPIPTIGLWLASSSLDLLDGMVARRLKQTSTLGIYIDIAADNVLRTTVWIAAAMAGATATATTTSTTGTTLSWFLSLFRLVLPAWIISLEWCTMICTQLQAQRQQGHWKHTSSASTSASTTSATTIQPHPWWIQQLFRNNFQNPLGCWAIYGLFGANMWWYASHYDVLVHAVPWFHVWQYLAYSGRILSMACECYLITTFLNQTNNNIDDNNNNNNNNDDMEEEGVEYKTESKEHHEHQQ